MRLIKCYVENFGLLRSAQFEFSKGLNCCISENGTGKTTLTAFIEAMLYGIGDSRKQSLDENPRKKYFPWKGGRFGGSLTLEAGKRKYVIERYFGQRPADDSFRLIELDSGKISYEYGENIGEELFGIDRDGFLRTVFLSEKNLQGKNDNKSISAKLSDLVGVDGDVGGFDEAIKLLEDRRRFYYKKGNAGEIANVRERILEKERELDNLSSVKEKALKMEGRLAELTEERGKLVSLENAERSKLEGIHRKMERESNEERYSTMLASLENAKSKLEKINLFFSEGIPTSAELDRMRDTATEAKRLRAEALAEKGNEDYTALGEFFKRGTDFTEIAEAERDAQLCDEYSRELTAIKNGFDQGSLEMRALFPKRVPKRDEIAGLKRAGVKGKRLLFGALALIFAALIPVGVILGDILGYAMIGAGALFALISAIIAFKPTKSNELLAFIREISDDGEKISSSNIDEIEKKLERYEQLERNRGEREAELNEKYCSLTLRVCSFLEKFPTVKEESILSSIRLIKSKYADYYSYSMKESSAENGKLEKMRRSENMTREVERFLAKYKTTGDDPFAEIRDNLTDLVYLQRTVSNLNNECDTFAVRFNVTGRKNEDKEESESAVKAAISEIAERLKGLSEEYTLTQRELNIARESIEREDEIRMSKEELEELYAKHVRSLELIKATSACLKEACDNITSKYLGKTKSKFEEYSKLIAGVDGEYAISTNFELTKTEGGEAHGIESYSRGTRDLYSLGLRLALVDALYEKETPFIILDDPFLSLDDAKLERAKSTLKSIGKTKQILYFTCAKSRAIE